MLNLDPNMNLSGRRAYKTIRLTFGEWDYRRTVDVTVGGNCSGLFNIEAAVGKAYETEFCGHIILEHQNGDALECTDDEGEGEQWLADMLVSAEIISTKPQST